jgi:hypothetical protein
MKTRGSAGISQLFLSSALEAGEWSASFPGRFKPKEKTFGNHWIGRWAGRRVGLNTVKTRKVSCFSRKSNLDRSARSPSLYQLSYPGSCTLLMAVLICSVMCSSLFRIHLLSDDTLTPLQMTTEWYFFTKIIALYCENNTKQERHPVHEIWSFVVLQHVVYMIPMVL